MVTRAHKSTSVVDPLSRRIVYIDLFDVLVSSDDGEVALSTDPVDKVRMLVNGNGVV